MATAQRFRLTPRVVGSFDQRAAPVTTPRIPLCADVARAIDTGFLNSEKSAIIIFTKFFHEIDFTKKISFAIFFSAVHFMLLYFFLQ